jgi:hypothetical protein
VRAGEDATILGVGEGVYRVMRKVDAVAQLKELAGWRRRGDELCCHGGAAVAQLKPDQTEGRTTRLSARRATAKDERPSMKIFSRRDDLTGIDDLVAELALARRALQRHPADRTLCGRRFTHSRRPMQFDARGYLVIDTCSCLRPAGHDRGCMCEHDIERVVYRVDDDGREQYATRPWR